MLSLCILCIIERNTVDDEKPIGKFQMLVQEENPGIYFEYSMTSGAVKPPGDDRYDWSVGDWSDCSGISNHSIV